MASLAENLAHQSEYERAEVLDGLTEEQFEELRWDWAFWARPNQLMPPGDWLTWLLLAGRGFGKALSLDTPLATPTGWTTMGRVSHGDVLFDECGQHCKVLVAHPVALGRPCYSVKFSDGSKIVADEDHLWTTIDRKTRKAFRRLVAVSSKPWIRRRHIPRIVSTAEIAETLYDGKEVNHAIPCALPLHGADVYLPVDPYLLGCWLGDGHTNSAAITTPDIEIVGAFEAAGFLMNAYTGGGTGLATTYGIRSELVQLRDATTGWYVASEDSFHRQLSLAGVLGNKHVPPQYLRAPVAQRLALVQGLFDSDGYCDPESGASEYVSIRRELAAGVHELCLSLGLKATIVQGRAMLNGKDCGPKYRVCCTAHSDSIRLFRLPRKFSNQRLAGAQAARTRRRYIVAVDRVPSVPVRCITVDSLSSLYLAGRSMIPTHNTRAAAEAVRTLVCGKTPLERGQYSRVAMVAETSADARDVLVEGQSGILSVHPPAFRPLYEPSKRRLTWPNGAVATLYNATEPDQLRGPQHDLCWCLAQASLVTLANGGEKQISLVKQGDMVKTREGPRRVEAAVCTKQDAVLYRLGCSGGLVLEATADHPIYCCGHGFVALSELREGDSLCVTTALNGAVSVIESVRRLPGLHPVYNLLIEGAHEFFANGILVHNCDELAKWQYAEATWDQLQFGMRLGAHPRQIIATTPRPIPTLKRILASNSTVVTRGVTLENKSNLAASFFTQVVERYKGTRLGRQELSAEILDDVPGALWTRATIDQAREPRQVPDMQRVVVAVDPSGIRNANDEGADSVGIIVAGKGADGRAYIMADRTCRLSPAGWGRVAVDAYRNFNADRIVAERNFGGAMVEHVIRTTDNDVSFRDLIASRGKIVRAEPVAALYEQGKVTHCGDLAELEDQMCEMSKDGYMGQGSPDRVDALVWALTELMLGTAGPMGVIPLRM